LKIAYLISTKDNVFAVTNSLGMFTVFGKCTNFIWQMRLQLYPVLQMLYSMSLSLFVQTKLTPHSLQYLLTWRFYRLQRNLLYGDNSTQYSVRCYILDCFWNWTLRQNTQWVFSRTNNVIMQPQFEVVFTLKRGEELCFRNVFVMRFSLRFFPS